MAEGVTRLMLLGHEARERQDLAGAVRYFRQAVDLATRNPTPYRNRDVHDSTFWLGLTYHEIGDISHAIEWLKKSADAGSVRAAGTLKGLESATPTPPSNQRVTPPAAWHPDPAGRHEQRYWDGAVWTAHVWTAGQQGSDPLVSVTPVNTGPESNKDLSAALTSAAWHPDPAGRHELRYWDGAVWTPQVWTAGQQSIDPLVSVTPVNTGPEPDKHPAGLAQTEDLVVMENSRRVAVLLAGAGGFTGAMARKWLNAYTEDPSVPPYGMQPYWIPPTASTPPQFVTIVGFYGVDTRLGYARHPAVDDSLLALMADDPNPRVREAVRARVSSD